MKLHFSKCIEFISCLFSVFIANDVFDYNLPLKNFHKFSNFLLMLIFSNVNWFDSPGANSLAFLLKKNTNQQNKPHWVLNSFLIWKIFIYLQKTSIILSLSFSSQQEGNWLSKDLMHNDIPWRKKFPDVSQTFQVQWHIKDFSHCYFYLIHISISIYI